MTNKEILQADLLDILFEHRNKAYGAYALRKQYSSRLWLAVGISFSLIVLLILFSFMNKNNKTESKLTATTDSVVVHLYDIPQEKEKPKEKQVEKQSENFKQVKSVNKIQIVPDNTKADVHEQEEIVEAVVGTKNEIGTLLVDPNKIVNTDIQNSTGTQLQEVVQEINFIPKEIPPSFPGGIDAWLNFLKKYLQTPVDLDAGQRIEVLVKFWIEKDGQLSRFELVKSGGNLFDKEVLRVMKKMPRWEPAYQNNSRIAVAYTQPVIFMGVEE